MSPRAKGERDGPSWHEETEFNVPDLRSQVGSGSSWDPKLNKEDLKKQGELIMYTFLFKNIIDAN